MSSAASAIRSTARAMAKIEMSIERDFDVTMISGLALREKQIQQNYRPVIGVHKWFARRPGTLFRGLILAEFGNGALQDTFFGGLYTKVP